MPDVKLVSSPARLVALRILRALDDSVAGRAAGGAAGGPEPRRPFKLTAFQAHAVERARRVMTRYGGVVIADSVGLGKTYIGLELIREALERGEPALVATPASLRRTWSPGLRALLRTTANAPDEPGTRLRWLSHTRLGLGRFDPEPRPGLVVVDEAHAFRTPGTRRYAALAGLCRRSSVVLLTATPVNNSVEDLYHLVRLFADDRAFRHVGVASLRDCFRYTAGPAAEQGAEVAGEECVRRVARELVIRRTRSIVEGGYGVGPSATGPVAAPTLRFPRRAPPRVIGYAPGATADMVRLVASLELTPYGVGVGELVRMGLLKRLESGRAAFRATLQRQGRFFRLAAEAAAEGRLASSADLAALMAGKPGDGDAAQLVIPELLLHRAPPDAPLEEVRASLARDLGRIQHLQSLTGGEDPKLQVLVREVAALTGSERVVVFTEFRDTARSVWEALLRAGIRAGRVDGGGAWLGKGRAGRRQVIDRFAPLANSRPEPPSRERVDVLVATDVLAEGLNLQDARHVVCYDLPWNPVRILQRIGRVDRLGSPHEEVVPHLFLPDGGLDDMLRLTRRIRRKLRGIADSVGAEQADELLRRLGERDGWSGAGELIGSALVEMERAAEDPRERLIALAARVGGIGGALPTRPHSPPPSVPIGRVARAADLRFRSADHGSAARWIVALRHRGSVRLVEMDAGRAILGEDGSASVAVLEASIMEGLSRDPSGSVTPEGPEPLAMTAAESVAAAGAVDVALAHVRRVESTGRAPARQRSASIEARLARRVRGVIEEAGPLASPRLLKLADDALARLESPPHPGSTAAMEDLVSEADAGADPERWLHSIGSRLDPPQNLRPQRLGESGTQVVAVLEIRP